MYLSPLRLAGFTGPVIHKKEIQLARKKLLAELELSGDLTITVHKQPLSKQDIIALFDSLNDEEVLAFHTAIFSDPALSAFLEESAITDESWQEKETYSMPAFKIFVSPYFAAAVNNLIQLILERKRTNRDFTALFQRPQFLLMQDAEVAFAAATKFYYRRKAVVQAFYAQLENSAGGNYEQIFDPVSMASKLTYVANRRVLPDEITDWKEATNLPLLNLLPDEFFGALRYDIANELNNICVIADTQNHSIKTGYEALLVAASIDCGTSLQEIIRDNIAIFKAKLAQGPAPTRTSSKKEGPRFTWSGIGIAVFIIIRLLFTANTCNNSSTPSYYNSTPSNFELDTTRAAIHRILNDSSVFK